MSPSKLVVVIVSLTSQVVYTNVLAFPRKAGVLGLFAEILWQNFDFESFLIRNEKALAVG